MGCGCGKKKNGGVPAAVEQQATETRLSGRVAMYEVVVGGKVITSTESAVAAREESRRLGGSLRVSSREATQEELSSKLQPATA